jgi:ABC-2 type transport system permease protein
MQASVYEKTLRDQRWQVLGFGIALAAMSSTAVFLWPSVRDTLQNFELPAAIKAFIGTDLSIATAAGYLSARYFGWVDILLIVYAVIAGTGAIAGEESGGTMDLLLAQPIARRAVVLQKVGAVVIGSAAIIAIGWLGFALSIPFVRIDVSLADTAIASANMLPITLLFFALSLWAGAVAPSRGVAAGMTIGFATAAYFIGTLANGVDSLRGLRYATPFYYYGSGSSLVHGIAWSHAGLLLGLAAGFVVLTVWTFERRDVSTGGSADVDVAGMLRRVMARGT